MNVVDDCLERVRTRYGVELNHTLAIKQRLKRAQECFQLPTTVSVHIITLFDELKAVQWDFTLPLAIDVEWFPCSSSDSPVQLVQLAQKDKVYLLDCHPSAELLWPVVSQQQQRQQRRREVLDLLTSVVESVPHVVVFGSTSTSSGDARALQARQIDFVSPIPRHKLREITCGGGGLSSAVGCKLGKPLDKDMQQSDWSQRPLLSDQIAYAALDAWVLLEM